MSEPHPRRAALPRPVEPPADGKVLVLLAHPALHRSRVNRQLVDAARDLPGVTVHDLYEAYPDFDIDVAREQALLRAHEIVVWQHPFYWYSTPALLKEWQDLVLEFGWAYGPGGTALHGKKLLSAITTGGPERAYQAEGFNRFTVRQLLAPIEQTARLCGLVYLPPFVVHGTHRLEEAEIARHADEYRRVLLALRDDRVDAAALAGASRIHVGLLGA
jgi:glutathione-regulated potassium-efflux system ancillary protein KefG